MAAACACVTGTLNDLSTLQALRMRSLIVCQARRDGPAPLQRGAAQWVGPFMWTGAGLAGAALLAPGPADAYETKAWMPRRHYRGMKEARTPPHFEFTMRKTSNTSSGHVTLPGMGAPATRPRPVQQASSVPIWVPVLGVVLIFLVAFWARIKAFFTGEGKTSGGRWIRDRSLGGKMVFIPDDAPSKPSAIASALPETSTGAATAYAGYAGYGAAIKAKRAASGRPKWFVYSPPLPVTPTTQQECRKRAKRILKKLENDKLLGGKDYDVLALIQLYQTCREGNVDVASPSMTTAARETMVRSAVQGTVTSAGQSATRTTRPVQMYPLPASAPEADLIASAVRDKLTLTETEDVLKQLAVRAPEYMELFTVMLGFDVSLTLPMLQQVVAEGRTSSP